MSRMAKLYQGVRANRMFEILMIGKENIDSENTEQKRTLTTSTTPNELISETEPKQFQVLPEKRSNIGRSSSLSNIPKKNSLDSRRRRCSSVPPTITIQYLPPCTTQNNSAHSYNLFNDMPGSDDGDFSGADSDVTYCPSDTEVLSSNSSLDLREEPSTSSAIFHGNINEGRKREFRSDPNKWKKNKNKKLRMSGKEYLGYTKQKNRKLKQDKMRPARRLGERCNSEFCKKSKVRNCDKLSDETRLEIHKSFWENMNWDQRKVYVNGLVTRKTTSRKTSDETSRREGTLEYNLPTTDGKQLQVCRVTFLNTLCLGSYTVQSWVKKAHCGVIPNLHAAPIPIAHTKFNHLQQLKEVLPRDCHLFYDNLPYV